MKGLLFVGILAFVSYAAADTEVVEKAALGPRQLAPRIWISSEEIHEAIHGKPAARRVQEKGQLRAHRIVKKPKTPAIAVPEPPRTIAGKIRLQHPAEEMLEEEVFEPVKPSRPQIREPSDGLFIPGPYYIPPPRNENDEEVEVSLGEEDYDWINVKRPEQALVGRAPIVIARSPYMMDEQ